MLKGHGLARQHFYPFFFHSLHSYYSCDEKLPQFQSQFQYIFFLIFCISNSKHTSCSLGNYPSNSIVKCVVQCGDLGEINWVPLGGVANRQTVINLICIIWRSLVITHYNKPVVWAQNRCAKPWSVSDAGLSPPGLGWKWVDYSPVVVSAVHPNDSSENNFHNIDKISEHCDD